MVYHFVKHIGFDIKADSLEQAKEIVEAIDEATDIEDVAYDTMIDAIDDVLDVGVLREDVYDDCDAHAGDSEYVGYTDDEDDDPEERLYDYLTGADDEDEEDDDVCYRLTDKGHDWLDFINGNYPQFNAADYDDHGKRIRPRRDTDVIDAIVNAIVKAFAEI